MCESQSKYQNIALPGASPNGGALFFMVFLAYIVCMSIKTVSAFLEGKIEVLEKGVPNHTETVISDVFVFNDFAYKVYKSDSTFFNENFSDLSSKENRFDFTRADFEWNNKLSPEIYLELKGLSVNGVVPTIGDPTDNADELVIVMKKIDMSDQLIKKLHNKTITISDCENIGEQLAKKLSELPLSNSEQTVYSDFLSRHKDIQPWIKTVDKYIPEKLARKYQEFVKEYIEANKDEFNSPNEMGMCADIHADNAIYKNGEFYPIDSYAPKKDWLHGYKFINLYRVATDIYNFLGKEGFNAVIEAYQKSSSEEVPRRHDKFLAIYCQLINWPYQYMLAEKESWRLDIADRYGKAVEEIYSNDNF
ncbi:hypothetical protein COB55_02255 [Candidatus Wolfebacteria bacterium]|nr:MAG: hypothetical protein COB55_02255 [Candidatus Wolfebacteria bacterium]